MALFLKKLKDSGRSAWLYYPDMPNRSEQKVCSITIVRPDASEESIHRLLKGGLEKLAQEKKLVLCFPNPLEEGWRWDKEEKAEDIQFLSMLQGKMDKPDDNPIPVNEKGIPSSQYMLESWHPMYDTHYYIGLGAGASMLTVMAALHPQNMAAVLLLDAECPNDNVMNKAAAVPMWLCGGSEELVEFASHINGVEIPKEHAMGTYKNALNPACRVVLDVPCQELTEAFLETVWSDFFSGLRRINTSEYGDCAERIDPENPGFVWFKDNLELDGTPHTWLVHVPSAVRKGEKGQVPVVFFYHGGSDNPAEAAEMGRFHEIGEMENFITVYPWGSNHAVWNMELAEEQADDLEYCMKLIQYMLDHYPIDPARVYLSGFSNGAGMAQTIAMLYPERIAALGHIDSNWPGVRYGRCSVDYQDVEPMRLALEKKKQSDLYMPVWYTYGTREASAPICKNCSQQHQYDFWKLFNHIERKPTRELEDLDGPEHGVDGEVSEIIYPDPRYPEHYYTVQRFFTAEEKRNYYNFVLMHDKGHEVAPKDALLAWNYMKQFRRGADGSVEVITEE